MSEKKTRRNNNNNMRNPATTTTTTSKKSIKNNVGSKTACCSKVGLKKGPWTAEEDELLANYINKEGQGRWRMLPKRAGLLRCGKSCRLRWLNYLRPSVKRGQIAPDEEDLILRLHRLLGNRWSLIAGRIPGRTDNEIKNYWNTHLSKKLISQGIDPRTHKPLDPQHSPTHHLKAASSSSSSKANGYYNENHQGISNEQQEDEDINYFTTTDDVFSSFVDSLINEDAFTYHNQMQADHALVEITPTLAQGWESPPIISTMFNQNDPKRADDQISHI